ncbi:hypothetical protein [Pseudomonas graminis]|uniref:Uncharacterized protein n=1 Tax=Pseudomonas graminis TaxID=158627 RepID=A0A1C2ECP4_9PSED|nr:hypothetical protein [Pseudomonas graminis]OCX24832.1 hypothetical protein BBI10_04235 [Pseudomonas graminis]
MKDEVDTFPTGSEPLESKLNAAVICLKLLTAISQHPSLFKEDDTLASALRSQGAFASLVMSFKHDNIMYQKNKVSLNHLKKQCDTCLDRGFRELDLMRSRALDVITNFKTKGSKPRKRTKSGLSTLVSELETLLIIQRKANHVLLAGLNVAIRELGVLSRENSPEPRIRLAAAAIDELREIVKLSSFRSPPVVVESNVTAIREQAQIE